MLRDIAKNLEKAIFGSQNENAPKYSLGGEDTKAVQEIAAEHEKGYSINGFTSEEIQKTKKWAEKFYAELKEKSPFFRAWYGDWREFDTKPVQATKVDGVEFDGVENWYGEYKVDDTDWVVKAGSRLKSETKTHNRRTSAQTEMLKAISGILKNAVLLDTRVSDMKQTNKQEYSAFMHVLYAPVTQNGKNKIAKVFVEQYYDASVKNVRRKAYSLTSIKIEPAGEGSADTGLHPMPNTDPIKTVADMYWFVKQKDKTFTPNKANKELLNENGTPKIFYHGTPNGDFYSFDESRIGAQTDYGVLGKGYYFTNDRSIANYYAGDLNSSRVMEVYLKAENPFYLERNNGESNAEAVSRTLGVEYIDTEAENENRSRMFTEWLKKNGYDSVISGKQVMVLDGSQVKSATDNIGTFDGSNPDIRYSLPSDDLLDAMIDDYISTEAETKYSLPEGIGERQFATKTGQETKVITDYAKRTLGLDKNRLYAKDSNEAQMLRAIDRINNVGTDESYKRLVNKQSNYTDDDVAESAILQAIYYSDKYSDPEKGLALTLKYNTQSTEAGRTLQAYKILPSLSPSGTMTWLAKHFYQEMTAERQK